MSVISLEEWRKKQVTTSSSKSQLHLNTPSEVTGQKLTKAEKELDKKTAEAVSGLCFIIWSAWTLPFTTRGKIARTYPELVGICAGEGLITMKIDSISWGRHWLATDEGLDYLEENEYYDGTD